jgi:hypothetical protein
MEFQESELEPAKSGAGIHFAVQVSPSALRHT